MGDIPVYIDAKTIIVNLLREDKKTFLPIDRLQELMDYIYVRLLEQDKLENYNISFDVLFDAIERTVIYNGDIFALDMEDGTIYLRNLQSFDEAANNCTLDNTLETIVRQFASEPAEAV